MEVNTDVLPCYCSCVAILYFACRKVITIRCRVQWSLTRGSLITPTFHWSITVSPEVEDVCQKNNMWEYHQGYCPGSCMLFRVGQQYSKGRETILIAVLSEIHDWDQAWPHCASSSALAEESHGEAKRLLNNLIILLKIKANLSVATGAAEGPRVWAAPVKSATSLK